MGGVYKSNSVQKLILKYYWPTLKILQNLPYLIWVIRSFVLNTSCLINDLSIDSIRNDCNHLLPVSCQE